jgi:hypothetical protein
VPPPITGGRADRAGPGHDERLAGQRDERPRRDRPLVDERDGADGEFSSASRIATAASTRPPKVLMSSTTAAAPAWSASRIVRARNGASPRSMMPSIGTT